MAVDPALTSELRTEIARRRTFAIISHPDAGKTTLTEKLLLYSGMIRTAGMVRGRKGGQAAASDWMGMEQERGISISASAMQFPYKDSVINVLDTPGHQDFCEDTYRTLTAADSAIMVIDAAKGVEAQTRKLFAVCKLRKTPVLTFINKMDLPGRDPLDLMTEVEEVLGLQASALTWPIGTGREFCGVIERLSGDVLLFERSVRGHADRCQITRMRPDSPECRAAIPEDILSRALTEVELLNVAGNSFSVDDFRAARVTPVFFGSALTNFGVEPFFDAFVEHAPPPGPRPVDQKDGREILIDPVDTPFCGYVFRLQANMNLRHRDSMAFVRICSGRFERGLVVKHHRLGQDVRLSRPHSMMAADRNTVDVAYPGDIVGIINPGMFTIGDTISLSGGFNFKPLPQFNPEVFAQVRPTDIGKRKGFDKGMEQLTEEGTVQLLRPYDDPTGRPLVAAVGRLQFEVLQYRLKHEYNVETEVLPLPYECSAWLVGDPEKFIKPTQAQMAYDRYNRIVVLFRSTWDKRYAVNQNPAHQLLDMA